MYNRNIVWAITSPQSRSFSVAALQQYSVSLLPLMTQEDTRIKLSTENKYVVEDLDVNSGSFPGSFGLIYCKHFSNCYNVLSKAGPAFTLGPVLTALITQHILLISSRIDRVDQSYRSSG